MFIVSVALSLIEITLIKMPSKEARNCPICHCPDNVNLSQHLRVFMVLVGKKEGN